MAFVRCYIGTDGQSHFEDLDLPPPDMERSIEQAASSITFTRSPNGRFSDWHDAPRRQYAIFLSCGTPHGMAILPRLSTAHRRGRGHAGTPTTAVAKSERLRGAVGALGQGGVDGATLLQTGSAATRKILPGTWLCDSSCCWGWGPASRVRRADGSGAGRPTQGLVERRNPSSNSVTFSACSCCTQCPAPSSRWTPVIRVQAVPFILSTAPGRW